MSKIRLPFIPFLLALALAAPALTGCGEDDEEGGTTSASALEEQLLPVSAVPGFKRERVSEWDNAIDLTVRGLFLPHSTLPSKGVDVLEDAGFEAAVGLDLVASEGDPFMSPHIVMDVIQLGSEEDARKVIDFLHEEDLKQPCPGPCSQEPGELEVDGIPGAKGAEQVPSSNPPEGAAPGFTAYTVEFAIGPVLYLVNGFGEPGQVKSGQIMDVARALYEHARQRA